MACVSGKRQSFEEFETFVQNFQLCQSYSQLSLSFSNSFHFDFCIHKVIRKKRRRRRITLLLISYLSSLSLSLFLKISSFQFLCGSQSKEGMIGFVSATRDVVESGGPVASCLFFYFVPVRCQTLKIQFFLAIQWLVRSTFSLLKRGTKRNIWQSYSE